MLNKTKFESERRMDMSRSTRLVMLIKNTHTLCERILLLHCVTNFWLKLLFYPLQG